MSVTGGKRGIKVGNRTASPAVTLVRRDVVGSLGVKFCLWRRQFVKARHTNDYSDHACSVSRGESTDMF